MSEKDFIYQALNESSDLLNDILKDKSILNSVASAIKELSNSLKDGGKILACGNGGSMCDSLHFVEELTGRYRKNRPPIAALSMDNAGHITCVANDFGFEYIFSRQVEGLGKKEDSLLAISTSGNSQNIIKAVQSAKNLGIKTVGLLGKDGGELKSIVDFPIIVPSQITDRIQEVHIKLIHIFIEGIERELYPDLYS